MNPHRDDEPLRASPNDPEDRLARRASSPRKQLAHGIVAALAVDTLFNVPSVLFMHLLRPENVALAVGKVLLGVNMLVGYAGGRVAARRGLAHDDTRSQWTMSWVVGILSMLVAEATVHARAALHPVQVTAQRVSAATSRASIVAGVVEFGVMVLLIRFGFAMGTYSQAKREGRALDDKDEAGAD